MKKEQRSGEDRRTGTTIPLDAPHYTVGDVAVRWSVSKRVVYEAIRTGDLPASRIGRGQSLRLSESDVREYEARSRAERGAAAVGSEVLTDSAGA